jgi:NitT/TauT family transport system permease protein
MPLVLSYSNKVRSALKAPANLGIDAIVILAIAGLIAAVASIFGHAAAPRPHAVHIDLSFKALPLYAFFSVSRAFLAYGLSLIFTLVYGTITARSHTAEKFMVPALDVLQSLPVLSFLPGLVLMFVHLFPTSWLGLELACVVMIFTAQAWNMAFSYHTSVRSIPQTLLEAARMQHLSGWQRFKVLELPSAMIGLVWNSMMSMAGGWFIITVNEAFTLNNQDYRLPGLGSYMNQAQIDWNVKAMIAGVIAMVGVIVLCDQVVWRPIVVWSQRFKLEDTSSAEKPKSWVLDLLRRSHLLNWVGKRLERWRHRKDETAAPVEHPHAHVAAVDPWWVNAIKGAVVFGLVVLAMWGTLKLVRIMAQLPLHDTSDSQGWLTVFGALGASFLRVTAAVIIGAAWTLPVGVLIGLSPKWSDRLQPFVQIVASFPAPMIYLIVVAFMAKLHIAFTFGCVFLMLLGTQWYTLFNVIAGAMAIPSDLREAGRIYHLPRTQQWLRLYVPAVFPYLVTGLITAAGGAWNATIVAEYISLTSPSGQQTTYSCFGLGYLLNIATADGNFALLAASVVTMGLAVVIINRIFWKRVYRYSEARFSLNV